MHAPLMARDHSYNAGFTLTFRMAAANTQSIALFPLGAGLFPDGLLQLTIFEIRYLKMIEQCQRLNEPFGVVALESGAEVQKPGQLERLHGWGCLASLIDVQTIATSVLSVRCQGGARFRLGEHQRGALGLWQGSAQIMAPDEPIAIPSDLQYLADKLGALIASTQKRQSETLLPFHPPYRLDECGWVANRWAELLPLPSMEKAALLSEGDPEARLYKISDWI